MKREKRKDRKGARSVASIEQAVQQVQEERRLFGAPLKDCLEELFVEDRMGREQIRNRCGVKKELTIDRILRPSAISGQLPIQRLRPNKSKAGAANVKRPRGSGSKIGNTGRAEDVTLYDMWTGELPAISTGSNRPPVRAVDDFYSYRPHLPTHIEKLVDMEAALQVEVEEGSARRSAVGRSDDGREEALTASTGETMEERADRELLEGVTDQNADNFDCSIGTISHHLDFHDDAQRKKTKTERNRDRKEREAREEREKQHAQKSFLQHFSLLPLYAKQYRQQAAANAHLASLKTSLADQAPRPKDALPLLPEEVPQSLRLLPSTHCNLFEGFERPKNKK